MKKVGKYLTAKVAGSVVGKVVKYGFYSILMFFGPTSVIGVVGIAGLAVSGLIVHSGAIEYGTNKAVQKLLDSRETLKLLSTEVDSSDIPLTSITLLTPLTPITSEEIDIS